MNDLIHWARQWLVGDEVKLARRWQSQTAIQRRELRRFEQRMGTSSEDQRVVLARARRWSGDWFAVGLPPSELLGMHCWTTGSTGSGKTFLVLGMLLQLLDARSCPIVVLDMKGELASMLTETVLPALAQTTAGAAVLKDLRIVRPFDSAFVPMLRVTAAEPGVAREIQALNLAAALEESLGAELGARMSHVFLRLASLAVELNRPLPEVTEWLQSPSKFAQDARRSGDRRLREYALTTFPRENRASLDALHARLDSFLFLPQVRAALSSQSCLSFSEALESGVTIIDLGDPPAGAERAARFWAGVLIGRLTRAILSRSLSDASPQTLVVLEEFQEALQRFQAEQFARLLALARHKRVALLFVNQQPGQLEAPLVRLLRTNTGLEMVFRCNAEDARSFAHALPVPEDATKPATARLGLARAMTRMPRRLFYLWLKDAPFRAQLVRSPRIDLAELRLLAARAPQDLRAFVRQGTVAVPSEKAPEESSPGSAPEEDEAADPGLFLPPATQPPDDFPALG